MTNLIANYRDYRKDTRFYIHGHRITEACGFLLKGIPGAVIVLEGATISATATDSADANDQHNVRLCRTNSDGAPITPVLTGLVTSGGSTTVFETGLTMTLNEHANRICMFVSGNNKSTQGIYETRLVASNTVGGQITVGSAFSNTPAAGDKFIIMPANQADAAWSTSSVKSVGSQVQALRYAGGLTAFKPFDGLDMPLGVGEGIGWFQQVIDNYSTTLDLVKWTELSIDVWGHVEGAGYRSQERNANFQPLGV